MNQFDKLLNRLKVEQAQFALDALKRPVERDTFEYGYRVGIVQGYEASINMLLKILVEEEYGDNDL